MLILAIGVCIGLAVREGTVYDQREEIAQLKAKLTKTQNEALWHKYQSEDLLKATDRLFETRALHQ